METVTRRGFLGLLGLAALPAVLPIHHRPGHSGGPQPTPTPTPPPPPPPPTSTYSATYTEAF
jgi:hypothetical protein